MQKPKYLMRKIGSLRNLRRAWLKVKEKTSVSGIDQVNLRMYARDLDENLRKLRKLFFKGWYVPAPALGISIPKAAGGVRKIGIFTIDDRVAQQAVLNVLEPIFEPDFLPISYAYRKGKSVHQVVEEILSLRDEGYEWVVDADIEKFFDSIDHEKLMGVISQKILEKSPLRLIYGWLSVGIMNQHRLERQHLGTIQGAIISPLLANIYLTEFDKILLEKGFKLIRYADDFVILCKSYEECEKAFQAAERALKSLNLALNRRKTKIVHFSEGFTFLGEHFNFKRGIVRRRRRKMKVSLYVTEQGSVLCKEKNRLKVVKDKKTLLELPTIKVDQVVVFGRVHVTTAVLVYLLTEGIDLVFLSNNGKYYGRLQSPESKNPDLKHLQLHVSEDSQRALEFSRSFITGKIHNMRTLLLKHNKQSVATEVKKAVERLSGYEEKVTEAHGIDEIRSYEGIASKEYFSVFPLILKDNMGFKNRQRRPPTDPVNSLLSLGYTLLLYDTLSAVNIAGLDPYLGFLHFSKYGRPSIALDLMEEFRSVIVESLVVSTINRGIFKSTDFVKDEENPKRILLNEESRRKFLAHYEKRVLTVFKYMLTEESVTYRRAFQLQVQHLINCFKNKKLQYQPVLLR